MLMAQGRKHMIKTNTKKIAIVGMVGSGKSYLAKSLGEKLGLPVFHLDCLWNLPNGKYEQDKILEKKIDEIVQSDKWIIDGNYRSSMAKRFENADLVIWLNLPTEICAESAKSRDENSETIGRPDYFACGSSDDSFNVEANLKTKEEYIMPLVVKHKTKVVELNSREDANKLISTFGSGKERMNKCIKTLPENPAFMQNGLKGYQYNLNTKEIGIYQVDCFKGHDRYHADTVSTYIYYVLDGEGKFCVDGEIFSVRKGDLMEIPPSKEFVYADDMKLMLIMTPDFDAKNCKSTKENDLY